MRLCFRLRPMAVLGLSLWSGTAFAATAPGSLPDGDFLSEVRGIHIPVLPPGSSRATNGEAAKRRALTADNIRLQKQVEQLQTQARQRAAATSNHHASDATLRELRREKGELLRKLTQANVALRAASQGAAAATGQPRDGSVDLRTSDPHGLQVQLAQMTADRAELAKALASVKAQAQAQDTQQKGTLRVLQHTVTALQSRLDMIHEHVTVDSNQQHSQQMAVRALTEKLTAAQAVMAQQVARNGELAKQNAALKGASQELAVQQQQVETLRAQLAAANKTATDLKTQWVTAQTDKARDNESQAERLTRLQAQRATVEKNNADLHAQLTQLQADKLQLDKTRDQSITTLQARLDGAMKESADLRGQVESLTSAQHVALKAADEANAALSAAQKMAQTTPMHTDKTQAERLEALQAQLAVVTKANTALKAQLITAQAGAPAAETIPSALTVASASTEAPLDLNTPQAQQAYASGVMMADLLRRTLALQNDLGEKPDTALLLAGVKDGVTGSVRLDKRVLTTQSEAVVARLSAKEKARYDSGVKRLEALTAKQTLLKRNGTLFFVQVRKGSRPLKEGESLSISLRESTLDGRVLREGKAMRGVYSTRLPYPVQQALMLGGLGGSVDVYCFASDIYPPNDVPAGLFAYTLMKYTVKAQS